MLRYGLFVSFVSLFLLPGSADLLQARQEAATSSEVATPKLSGTSLKVSLRLPDETTFLGKATVRLIRDEGSALTGELQALQGYFVFPDLPPGKYQVNVSATGYDDAQLNTQIEAAHGQRTLFVVLQPRTVPKQAETVPVAKTEESVATTPNAASSLVPAPKPAGAAFPDYWTPGELESMVPPVDPAVACPLQDVLNGVGRRMTEFVHNLERFEATETIEHFTVSGEKTVGPPEIRKFDYMVMVSQNRVGTFLMEEYRDGLENSNGFPAHVATHGLPALALLFHPTLAGDFQFKCEGLGQWDGRTVWQVHFAQRTDKPVRIRAYVINGATFYVQIEGRAWIDPGSYQVLRLESEMAQPIPEIKLAQEHIIIEYAPVQFRTQNMQIWLPQSAELYVDRRGRRYFRRHSFTNFKVFSVETTESFQPPREAYSFTNLSDRDIAGVLTVTPVPGAKRREIVLKFTVPAGGHVVKIVGPGKDVNLPVTDVASATFAHNGEEGSIRVDAELAKETTLDVIPKAVSK